MQPFKLLFCWTAVNCQLGHNLLQKFDQLLTSDTEEVLGTKKRQAVGLLPVCLDGDEYECSYFSLKNIF